MENLELDQQVDQGLQQEEQAPSQEAAQETPAVEEQQHPQESTTVPLEALEKLRGELQEIKRQNFLLQQQLLQQQEAPQPAEVDNDPLAGMEEDDILTVGDIKKLMQKMQAQPSPQTAPQVDPRLAKLQQSEVQARAFYSDYDDKVQRLIPLVKTNPALQEALLNSPNPAMLAYQLADTLPATAPAQGTKPAAPAQHPQPGDALKKPGTGISAGGGGAVSPADKWLTMSPEEFEAEIARVKRGT